MKDVRVWTREVIDALNRMASIEAKRSRKADAEGDETMGLVHEHTEAVLREAVTAIEGMPCE